MKTAIFLLLVVSLVLVPLKAGSFDHAGQKEAVRDNLALPEYGLLKQDITRVQRQPQEILLSSKRRKPKWFAPVEGPIIQRNTSIARSNRQVPSHRGRTTGKSYAVLPGSISISDTNIRRPGCLLSSRNGRKDHNASDEETS